MTIISALPYNLQNGQNADATKIMADLNQIRNDVNNNVTNNPGTITSITAGTGLSGGTITSSGTVALADSTPNTLAGYNNSGVFSDVTIGANLTLSGGVLAATGGGGGSTTFAALTDVVVGTGTNHNMMAVNAIPPLSAADQNTGFGQPVFSNLTNGQTNSAFGAYSLQLITTGNGNSGFGQASLNQMVSGSGNTGIGHNAGYAIDLGSHNTLLGENADVNNGSAANRTAIGYSAICTADNTMQLGNSSVTDVYFGNPAVTTIHAGSLTTNGTDSWTFGAFNATDPQVQAGTVTVVINGVTVTLLTA